MKRILTQRFLLSSSLFRSTKLNNSLIQPLTCSLNQSFATMIEQDNIPGIRTRLNVLGLPLESCTCKGNPITGFYRTGFCDTGDQDYGKHTVAAVMDDEFLRFSKSKGNDLSTSHLPHFPGLKPGHRWCVCVLRWKEAFEAGKAPKVILNATHAAALEFVTLEQLKSKAFEDS